MFNVCEGQSYFTKYDSATKKFAIIEEVGNSSILRSAFIYNYFSGGYGFPHFASANGKWFFMNKKLKIISDSFDYIDAHFLGEMQLSPVKYKNKWGIIDIEGKLIERIKIPDSCFFYSPQFYQIIKIKKGIIYAFNKRDYWDTVLNIKDSLTDTYFSRERIYPQKKMKYGYVNKYYKTIIEFKYDEAEALSDKGRAKVKYKGKYGVINDKGESIVPCIYDVIDWRDEDDSIISVLKNKKYGIINFNGNILIDFIYDGIHPLRNYH